MFQIGLEKYLRFEKLKILCRGCMLLVILKENKLLEPFTKKIAECKSKSVSGGRSIKEKRRQTIC